MHGFVFSRFVNHTMANLEPDDPNPVAMKHATAVQQGQEPGMTREQSLEWLHQVEREMRGGGGEEHKVEPSNVKEEGEREKTQAGRRDRLCDAAKTPSPQ